MTDINIKCAPRVLIAPLQGLGSGSIGWGRRAILLTDKALETRAGEIQEQFDSQGIKTIIFAREGLSSNTETLDEVLSLARGSHADMVAVLGGEKVLSLGRLIAAVTLSDLHARDLMDGRASEQRGLPIIEVPSSGHHTLLFRKEALLVDSISSRAVLYPLPDPPSETVLLDSSIPGRLPMRTSAFSAASLLFSAVEAFLSPRSDFFSDVQARSAIKNAADLLRRVKKEYIDPDYRVQEAETAVLAAFSIGLTGPGPGMILSWAVAAAAAAPKAAVEAVLLTWVLESPLYSGSPKLKELTALISESAEDASDNPAEEIRSLFGRLEFPGRLRELNAELSDILPAASWAVDMLGIERSDLDEGTFREILELSS